ncbi:hypothetical protein H0H92_011823 [Tricholoma furcatifolium]|nr:hypothetical protein H0H92_011823 [Tricholoma furcatifolium]
MYRASDGYRPRSRRAEQSFEVGPNDDELARDGATRYTGLPGHHPGGNGTTTTDNIALQRRPNEMPFTTPRREIASPGAQGYAGRLTSGPRHQQGSYGPTGQEIGGIDAVGRPLQTMAFGSAAEGFHTSWVAPGANDGNHRAGESQYDPSTPARRVRFNDGADIAAITRRGARSSGRNGGNGANNTFDELTLSEQAPRAFPASLYTQPTSPAVAFTGDDGLLNRETISQTAVHNSTGNIASDAARQRHVIHPRCARIVEALRILASYGLGNEAYETLIKEPATNPSMGGFKLRVVHGGQRTEVTVKPSRNSGFVTVRNVISSLRSGLGYTTWPVEEMAELIEVMIQKIEDRETWEEVAPRQ